ncbi:lisH domain-containing protein C1711.05-like isoform X1 [Cyprinus carpio]|uniref:LisH domain-containing protein C1711.05-like isoform X1 n=1 Tax=Cyprinus carpio TaxID=7962 RepID=A0A9Q9VCM7_CYPCA|nr:lisH domain-containing protein C1711.05-like isoform X1 [Cyprinus carpio]
MEELVSSQSDVVGRLAFKYMEMCKVDSSSDSESESNPRGSDVSSKGCDSSAPEAPQTLQRFTGQHQQSLDPYDGSSEDSGSSAEGSKKQRLGGFRAKGTGRRSAPGEVRARSGAADVQMRSSSDSEQETPDQGLCSPCKSLMCVKADLSDSGFNTRSSLNSPAVPSARDTPSPDSPALHAAFSKRKFFPPPGDADDGMQRKRQCISDMEVESVAF